MINSKNKKVFKGILFYVLNVIFLSPVIIYGGQNFSIDSYGILLDYKIHINNFIGSYRWFGAFIYKVYCDIFNHNPILDSTIDSIVFIILIAAIVLALSYTIYTKLPEKSRFSYFAINLSVLISVLNVWFCNVLSFPECIFITVIGVILCFGALIIFIKNQSIKGCILTAILLILSTGIYQQFLFVFTIYVIAICGCEIIKNNEKAFKDIFFRYIKPVVVIIVSGGIYFVIGKLIQKIFHVTANSRAQVSLTRIIENCLYFARNQHSYLKGRGFFNSEILTICFLVIGFIWFIFTVVDWKKNKDTLKTIALWLSFACAYISAYAPGILSTSHAARAMFALFSIFALFVIGTLVLTDNKYIKVVLCAILMVVLVADIFVFVKCEIDFKKQNDIDKIWCDEVIKGIEEYEQDGAEIKIIYYCYDNQRDIEKFAESVTSYVQFSGEMISYFSGKDIVIKDMSVEKKEKYFEDKEWDEINTEEQMIFDGDKLYLCCY